MIAEVSFDSIQRWMRGNDLLVLLPTDAPQARSDILARLKSVSHSTLASEFDTGSQPLLIAPTSGSTGDQPSLAVLTLTAVQHSAKTTLDFLGGPAIWVSALPTNHIAGFQVVFRSTLAGFKPIETAPQRAFFQPEPEFVEQFWAAINAGQRVYTSLVPTQLQRCIEQAGLGLELLQQCHGILVGGSAIAADLQQKARDLGLPVTLTYGMTETAGGCVYNGHPLPGTRVKIQNGVIWLSGSTLLAGYVDSPSPLVTENGARWLVTKDGGKLTNPHGQEIVAGGSSDTLTVSGRLDDVIVHGGKKTSAQKLVKLISTLPQIEYAYVFGMPSKKWGQMLTLCCVPKTAGASPYQSTNKMSLCQNTNETPKTLLPQNAVSQSLDESRLEGQDSFKLSCASSPAASQLRAELVSKIRELVAKEIGLHSVPQFMVELSEIPLSTLGKPNGAKMRKLATDLWHNASDGGTNV